MQTQARFWAGKAKFDSRMLGDVEETVVKTREWISCAAEVVVSVVLVPVVVDVGYVHPLPTPI